MIQMRIYKNMDTIEDRRGEGRVRGKKEKGGRLMRKKKEHHYGGTIIIIIITNCISRSSTIWWRFLKKGSDTPTIIDFKYTYFTCCYGNNVIKNRYYYSIINRPLSSHW